VHGVGIVSDSRSTTGAASESDFDRLYRSSRDPMIRLARLFTGSTAAAEEIVQEAFLRIYQRGGSPDNPEAYLRTTVTNLCRSHLRRLRLERNVSHRGDVSVQNPEIDETWDALCRLPFRQRSVVILRFYEDLSVEEIANALGCRLGTVKSRLHRGLEKLRSELL
jgi:RNA polymerase sigma-70 factor (sigma-E family)